MKNDPVQTTTKHFRLNEMKPWLPADKGNLHKFDTHLNSADVVPIKSTMRHDLGPRQLFYNVINIEIRLRFCNILTY